MLPWDPPRASKCGPWPWIQRSTPNVGEWAQAGRTTHRSALSMKKSLRGKRKMLYTRREACHLPLLLLPLGFIYLLFSLLPNPQLKTLNSGQPKAKTSASFHAVGALRSPLGAPHSPIFLRSQVLSLSLSLSNSPSRFVAGRVFSGSSERKPCRFAGFLISRLLFFSFFSLISRSIRFLLELTRFFDDLCAWLFC